MEAFKIGEKVKFLDRTGGGVVMKIIDPKTVCVAGDDGFEVPVLITELVKLDPSTPGGRYFDKHYNTQTEKNVKNDKNIQTTDNEDDIVISTISENLTKIRKSEEVWLAYVPHDQKWLMTGFMDVFLINNSSCDLLYNLFHRTPLGHYEGVDYGSVFADSKLLIATVNREDLLRWSDGFLQFLFHKSQCREVLPPFNSEFRIDGKKFFKEGNFRTSSLIEGKGILVKIVSLTDYFKVEDERERGVKPALKEGLITEPRPLIFTHLTAPREALVDLHIHELVEDPGDFEKSEILDYQKNYFLKCMDGAIKEGFLKLTVIHGVGNGVLRSTLLELLKNYKGIEILDAPMSKFGVGAIEIRIPHNQE